MCQGKDNNKIAGRQKPKETKQTRNKINSKIQWAAENSTNKSYPYCVGE